jgi:molecular chaperone GrpE
MTEGIDTEIDPDDAHEARSDDVGGSESDPIDALEKATAAADENWAKYLRATAELENLRKRAARDVENARKFGVEQFAGELLVVIDSLEMGLEAAPDATVESLLEGKQATLKLLRAALVKSGIESIDPDGEPFDPQLHEAMTMQPSDTAEPGSVLAVVQKGYQLNGRLLRPARVIVASDVN